MDTYRQLVEHEFQQSKETLDAFMKNEDSYKSIVAAAELMASAFRQKKKAIACGNGGSHCDAIHFAEELTGRYREDREPLPALAISNPSHLTCVGNDFGFDQVFSRYISAHGNDGDILLGISTSGNSRNVILAMEEAKRKGMKTIFLTGGIKENAWTSTMVDCLISVPFKGYADRIQEIHIKIIHSLILCLEKILFEN